MKPVLSRWFHTYLSIRVSSNAIMS